MRKMTKSEQRKKHLENLSVIFNLPYSETKVIFKQLKEIESRGHMLAEQHCNGEIDGERYEQEIEKFKTRLKLLVPKEILKQVYLNGDPRGYFLKINDDYMRVNKLQLDTDWGGYGIICPKDI